MKIMRAIKTDLDLNHAQRAACMRHAGAGGTRSAIRSVFLNVSGMMKNHHLAQAIADVGLYEFRWQLQSKGQRYGCEGKLADRFFPSTQRCCRCGHEKEVRLAERVYCCESCGQVIDRKLNAAINREQLLDC